MPSETKKPYTISLPLLILFSFLSILLTLRHLNVSFQFAELASLRSLVDGTAAKPFQLRVLVPSSIKLFELLFQTTFSEETLTKISAIVEILSIFFGSILLTKILATLSGSRRLIALGIFFYFAALIWAFCFVGSDNWYYPSDGLAIFFGLAIIYITYRKVEYLPYLITVAAFNRETSLFYLIFLLLRSDLAIRNKLTVSMVSIAGWGLVKIFLLWIYLENPGAAAEWKLSLNANLLLTERALHWWIMAAILTVTSFFSNAAALPFLIFSAFTFLLNLCFANIYELRAYAECLVIVGVSIPLIFGRVFSRYEDPS